MSINIPRGTYDLYGSNMRLRENVVEDIKTIMKSYMFELIETPVFEQIELFKRTSGDSSDAVNKEMYEFVDKGDRKMALRPELTAPVARSFVDEKLYATKPNARYCYYMPAFRYERPQKGRYRQFYQMGVECFGSKNANVDVEIISLFTNILNHFNLEDKVVLKINSIGNKKSRDDYNKALKEYYRPHISTMCEDCKKRYETNPLRLLDCKVDSKNEYISNPPLIKEYLDNESTFYFNEVLELLKAMNINYEIDYKLVRGLDYYNDIVFEFIDEKSNLAICAGGRYDNLLNQISDKSSPAFGFGLGIERFIDVLLSYNADLKNDYELESDIIYIPLTKDAVSICLNSMHKLRVEGIKCFMNDDVKSFKANIKSAEKLNAVYAVIIGEDEIENNIVTVKNLLSREEEKVSLDSFEADLLSEGDDHEH